MDFLEEFGEYDTEMFEHKKMKITKEIALNNLLAIEDELKDFTKMDGRTAKTESHGACRKTRLQERTDVLPLRLALTAAQTTPGGATEMAELLGKSESMRRLRFSIDLLQK